jgi:hypothetical protein
MMQIFITQKVQNRLYESTSNFITQQNSSQLQWSSLDLCWGQYYQLTQLELLKILLISIAARLLSSTSKFYGPFLEHLS